MNETKRTLIMLGVILLVAAVVIISIIISGNYFEKSKAKIEELMEKEETHIIYLGRPTCPFCAEMEPYLTKYAKDFDIDYFYVNTDNLRDFQLEEILSYFNVNIYEFGTPYIVTVSNGNVTDELKGFAGPVYLVDFLKRTGFIPSDAVIDGVPNMLNDEEFTELKNNLEVTVNSSEPKMVFYNSDVCIYCLEMKPVLERYATENDFEYFDVKTNIITAEQLDELLELVGSTRENFGTPYTVIVKDGKVLSELRGYSGEESLKNFLNEAGFIK